MSEKVPFSWDDLHAHFPQEEIAKLRKQLVEEYRIGKYTDKELINRYHMSKQTFYDSIERYKNAIEIKDFMDESKTPRNPHRTILPEHKEIVKKIIKADQEELRKKQAQFEADMKISGKNLKPEKLEKLKKEMSSSLKGCRKIANEFNMEMSMNGEEITISKSKVNDIKREMTNYQVIEVKELSTSLYRPSEPYVAFAMDFTEKVIAGGERAYIINILDKYNNEKIVLDAHKSQDADAVISSLAKFDKQIKHNGITIKFFLISFTQEAHGKMDLLNVI